MSVIAGCSLFNGVILLADCRVTVKRQGNQDIYCDNAQKLFQLTPTTALGFVGDLETATPIIRELHKQINLSIKQNKNSRLHPLQISKWLPRYFRSSYNQLAKRKNVRRVNFMAGSVILNRGNVIERSKVVEIMERFRLGKLSAQRNWMPNILVQIMKTPGNSSKHVILSDIPSNLLYYMQSPDFIPQHLNPLEYAAIGSGENTVIEIDKNVDWIFAGDVGNSFFEGSALRQTVSSFVGRNSITSVGGMYPAIKINRQGAEFLGYSSTIPVGGTKFELGINSDGRWFQKNHTTGKEIKLLFPWEIEPEKLKNDERFDDLQEALNRMRSS
jgi:hypothetical protein